MIAGLTLNLGLLAYFKYVNFFIDNLNAVLGSLWPPASVVLPIGISFYSFTQIAFLVDTYQGKVQEAKFIHYGLFVTYFPHLIAGPVLHHSQMMPQFAAAKVYLPRSTNLVAGSFIFCLGLFKKVILADGIGPYADAVFRAADLGDAISTTEAWIGAVAYALQLYFDFSGYSDMAVGISWMFNVRLPFNFDAPYRAVSISDFWRRWHISLSTFLRDYLYVVLGGNRKGEFRRYVNLATTMLLGGLWHGASWSFVIWGGLHGLYLLVNHGFRALLGANAMARLDRSKVWTILSWAVTMVCVVCAWVFFRSQTLSGAAVMLQAMGGAQAPLHEWHVLWNAGLPVSTGAGWCAVLGVLAVLGPNSNRIGEWLLESVDRWGRAKLAAATFGLSSALFLVLINTSRDSVSAFIYFNF